MLVRIVIGLFLLLGGISGELVLRGTNLSANHNRSIWNHHRGGHMTNDDIIVIGCIIFVMLNIILTSIASAVELWSGHNAKEET